MSKVLRFLASLFFLMASYGAFASVVEPSESKNRLQIVQSQPASFLPETSSFSVSADQGLSRNLLQFDLIVLPQADGSPSFQFEPLVVISLPRQGDLAGEFFENPGVLYYYNARWYEPTLGRFISTDPIRSGENWEIYALANPLRYVDPSGLDPVLFNLPAVQDFFKGVSDAGNKFEKGKADYVEGVVNPLSSNNSAPAIAGKITTVASLAIPGVLEFRAALATKTVPLLLEKAVIGAGASGAVSTGMEVVNGSDMSSGTTWARVGSSTAFGAWASPLKLPQLPKLLQGVPAAGTAGFLNSTVSDGLSGQVPDMGKASVSAAIGSGFSIVGATYADLVPKTRLGGIPIFPILDKTASKFVATETKQVLSGSGEKKDGR